MEKPFRAYLGDEPFVFVCYSHEDEGIVYPEIQWLHERAVNVWYDEGISAGKVWRAEIATTIQRASKFLFYISPASLRSAHCHREIEYALDKGIPVVPVYLHKTELPPQLELALNRVQALHRAADGAYRDHLLEALASKANGGLRPAITRRRSFVRSLVPILATAVLAVGGWWYWSTGAWHTTPTVTAKASERSIVVLPFANLSDDAENGYLADGFSEELMGALAKVPGLRLAARTSSFYFKTHPADLATIGAALNVSYALEGSVRRHGNALRVTASLIEIANGFEVASLVLDRTIDDLLKLQSDIAVAIVDAFALQLSSAEVRSATAAGTTSAEAFDLFLKAQDHMRRDNAADFVLAQQLLEAAIALDPHFYAAYTALSIAIARGAVRAADYGSMQDRMKTVSEQLKAADPKGTRPTIAGERFWEFFIQHNWRSAEAVVRREFFAHPNGTGWLVPYGHLLANAGLVTAALDYFSRARQLDPFNPDVVEKVGDMLLALRRYDDALVAYERCLELAPERTGCLGQKAITLSSMGRVDEARALFGDKPPRAFLCAWGLGPCKPYDDPEPAYNAGMAAQAGDFDAAFEWLNKAVGGIFITQIRWQAWKQQASKEFVADPRYQQLLERIGLTDQWQAELCAHAQTLTAVTQIAVTCAPAAASTGSSRS